jgi:spermidine synthase
MAEIRRRGGRVLIHGLGLGMIVKFALAQANVTHVDVVELERDVINLVGRHYEDERLTIHHGDAMKYEWPPEAGWSVVWHDIWGDFQPGNLEEMDFLHRRFAARCEWQGSWSQDHLLARQRAAGVR